MASASVIFDIVGRDRASDKFDKVGNSADRSGGKLAKFGKVAKVAALGLAAGAGAAAVGLFQMTKNAIEDAAGQRRLAIALRNSAGATKSQVAAVEDWISKQGVALGVTDDELRPALQKLVQATGDVGKAQKLASLAMDVSAGSGKSLETVSTALVRAQNGNIAALGKLGIKTKDAEGNTIGFREATRRLGDAFKGQAAAGANTLDGKMRRLKLVFDETKETVGAKLIPIVTKLADWFLAKGLPALSAFGSYLGDKLPPIFTKVKAVVSQVLGALQGDVSSKLGGIKGIFQDTISIVTSLWKAFGPTILATLRTTFESVKAILSGAFDVIRGIFKTVSALLKGDWRGVWNGIKLILRGAVTALVGAVRGLWGLVKGVFRAGGVALKAAFKGIWDGIKSLARTGAEGLVNGIKAIPGKLLSLTGKFLNAGKGLIQAILRGLGKVGNVAGDFAGDVWNALKSVINAGIDKLNGLLEFDFKVKGIGFTVNAPNIPHLAKGGIVNRPTVALIGEAGPEAVVPLRGRHAPTVAGGGGNTYITLNVTGAVDPVAAGKQIEQVLRQMVRATGRPLQVPVG